MPTSSQTIQLRAHDNRPLDRAELQRSFAEFLQKADAGELRTLSGILGRYLTMKPRAQSNAGRAVWRNCRGVPGCIERQERSGKLNLIGRAITMQCSHRHSDSVQPCD